MAGNANSGRRTDPIWADAIRKAVKRRQEGTDIRALDRLAERLVASGLEGDISALKEIGDRLDGKPAQTVSGTDGGPIKHELVLRWMTPEIAKAHGLG